MLTTKTVATVIHATRPAVWAFIADPRQVPPGYAIEKIEERPGWFRRTVRAQVLGITVRVTLETAEYDPPATITWITRDITSKMPRWLLVSGERDTWTLTEVGEGATRIERTLQLRHQLPGTKLAGMGLRRQLRQVSKALGG